MAACRPRDSLCGRAVPMRAISSKYLPDFARSRRCRVCTARPWRLGGIVAILALGCITRRVRCSHPLVLGAAPRRSESPYVQYGYARPSRRHPIRSIACMVVNVSIRSGDDSTERAHPMKDDGGGAWTGDRRGQSDSTPSPSARVE